MRILVLTKRQYTARDLLDDRYGRLYELPEALAKAGHEVMGLVTSYRYRRTAHHVSAAAVDWQSVNVGPSAPWHWFLWSQKLRRWRPDVIWASSDAFHCIAAVALGRKWRVPVVLDLYDNYDHFAATRLPGVSAAYHRACRQASHLTTVSHALSEHVSRHIAPGVRSTVIPNCVRSDLFRPMDRELCRQQLGLPVDTRLIGTAGAIHHSRGIEDMFKAFHRLAADDPKLYLVIAGPQDDAVTCFPHPRIINLGMLDWTKVPVLINALDVAIVCNRDDSFGRYCHPLKLQEAMACHVPVVAAAVGDVCRLLANTPQALYAPGDYIHLATQVRANLEAPRHALQIQVPGWSELAEKVQGALIQAIGSANSSHTL